MIFRELKIYNFGLYSDEHVLELSPNKKGNRNVTLFFGQNGVGKSTMLEALQLTIFGSFYLGEKTSRTEYESYLYKRCYRNPEIKTSEQNTFLELNFDYSKSGNLVNYRIVRSWYSNPNNVNEKLMIFENDLEIEGLSFKEKNIFIRELIPPGFAKVMFFDGERLQSMTDDVVLNSFVADCCVSLFGLNLVNTLQKDIEHYSNRLAADKKDSQFANEIKALDEEVVKNIKEKERLIEAEVELAGKEDRIKKEISDEENNIANQGRWVADKVEQINEKRRGLEVKIEGGRKNLVEIFTALGPFAVVRELCLKLRDRLNEEKEFEKHRSANKVINEKLKAFETAVELPVWKEVGIADMAKRKLLLKGLSVYVQESGASNKEPIHELTDSERSTLLTWIEEINSEIPRKIKSITESLELNELKLQELNKESSTFSKTENVQSSLKNIQELNQKLGACGNEKKSLSKKIEEVDGRIVFYQSKKESVLKKISGEEEVNRKIALSQKTITILKEYSDKLLAKKMKRLEAELVNKFNLLCRKANYFDRAHIDNETFNVYLYKGKHEVSQAHLSAGEKQLLALSMLWSLHSIANVSLPMIIDTPLARLDKKHRTALIKEFLPEVSDQVIVLGTEIELSSEVVKQLLPSLNNYYELKYDHKNHRTKALKKDPALLVEIEA